jgi:hypothetical protein
MVTQCIIAHSPLPTITVLSLSYSSHIFSRISTYLLA